MMAAAEAAHAVSGNRVRSTSGALTTNATRTSKPVEWWPWGPAFALVSVELVAAKQISAMITWATSTRSCRPRRSQLGRGVAGIVVSVTNVAANLRTAFCSMFISVGALTPEPRPPPGVSATPYPSRGGPAGGGRRHREGRARATGLIPAGQAGNGLAWPTPATH